MSTLRVRRPVVAWLLAVLLAAVLPRAAGAQTQIKPYIMIVFDTSGSMTWNYGGSSTWGDGTRDPWGARWCCPGSGTAGDPSRLYACKSAMYRMVSATGDVIFGLTKFPQYFGTREMDWYYDNQVGGAYDQLRYDGECSSGTVTDYRVVDLGEESANSILMWLDQREYSGAGTPLSPSERELRADGPTPIAWTLGQTESYLGTIVAGDSYWNCRPYKVILLTDGEETCSGDPVGAVTSLRTTVGGGRTKDVRTCVIGYGSTAIGELNSMASAGRCFDSTTTAYNPTNEDELAVVLFQIISGTVLTEVCDGADNDCDTLTDEGFTKYCNRPGGISTPTLCTDPGETVCNGSDDNCNGATDEGLLGPCGTCTTPSESCGDGVDNDCDGATDEGCPGGCVPEVCDGVDNDCDTVADDGVGSRTCGSDVGDCSYGTQSCVGGAWGACTGGVGPATEACDNRDNDCDGLTDGLTRSCGSSVGVCVPGTQLCTAGAWGACSGGYAGTTEVCNLLDDDCDGATDEGNPGGGASCGSAVGECRPGTVQCTGGVLACTGGTDASAEICDNRDNDCDGETDEGNPGGGEPCYSGPPATRAVGVCRDGVTQCAGGSYACAGETVPSAEVCNGLDDDCDGAVDDSVTLTISCTPPPPGICVAGTPACVGGVPVCAGEVPGTPEVCDNVDNDCDGETDEGLSRSCGTDEGECRAGVQTCAAGAWGACAGSVGPAVETCDNLDNDCDGVTDGLTRPCGTDEGACRAGVQTCAAGAWGACVGSVGPAVEVCDNLDNDCDTETDEGNPGGGAGCGSTIGECLPGIVRCVTGTLVCDGGREPVPEACDGRDNDCDGETDEGNPGGGATCYSGPAGTAGIGSCESGVEQCLAGSIVCTGETLPRPEDCNGLDDDCDRETDEDLSSGTCGTDEGECAAGTRRCVAGAWACDGELGPTEEVCDNLDNDCDGATDEANPGGGVPCGWDPEHREAWDTGICEPGIYRCIDGVLVCEGMIGPVAEWCNALDDDCNGYVDDGLALGEACGEDRGECSPGRLECLDGIVQCVGGHGRSVEVCDCLDNDCDGETDDEAECAGGAVCVDCACAVPCDPAVEFACPVGRVCECGVVPVNPSACYCVRPAETCGEETCEPCEQCVADECQPITCLDCQRCEPATETCVDACTRVTCPAGQICICGECRPPDCYTPGYECPPGQRCRARICEPDPCWAVACTPPAFCRDGACHPPCDADDTCAPCLFCYDGTCVTDRCCGVTCPAPEEVCVAGTCTAACAGVECAWPFECDPATGRCTEPPCLYVDCSAGFECRDGTCVATAGPPDGGGDADGGGDEAGGADTPRSGGQMLATGAGGCVCTVTRSAAQPAAGLATLALALLGSALLRRRRRPGGGEG